MRLDLEERNCTQLQRFLDPKRVTREVEGKMQTNVEVNGYSIYGKKWKNRTKKLNAEFMVVSKQQDKS